MKKAFILSIFTVFSFLTAQAQPFSGIGGGSDSNLKLIIGATGGVNLSRYGLSDEFSSYTSKTLFGYNGGITAGLATSDKFSILLGINFIQKGTRLESGTLDLGNGDVGYNSIKEKLNFLSIPLMARYQLFGENFGMTLSAGLSFNFGLGGSYSSFYQGKLGVYEPESGKAKFGSGINDNYKSFQAGILLSPGVIFPIGEKGKFTVNVMWDLGLGNMFNEGYRTSGGGTVVGEWKNRSTIFTIGYEHRLEFGTVVK